MQMSRSVFPIVVICGTFSSGCAEDVPVQPGSLPRPANPRSAGKPDSAAVPTPHNLMHVSPSIYSGGQPHSDAVFAELARLGIRTIVSVDGARPNVAVARQHGLRYVHIPIGYDGIDARAGGALARLVRDAEGPFYVHCHHGRHRGPAAATVACLAASELDSKQALKYLKQAGTSKDYAGLWRDVENYRAPASDAELPELVEVAEVGSLVAAMAQIDRAWDNLKLCRDADWNAPDNHPDIVPAQESLLLKEAFHESGRNLSANYDTQFKLWLTEAEQQAHQLEKALKARQLEQAAKAFQQLQSTCKRCHAKHRN